MVDLTIDITMECANDAFQDGRVVLEVSRTLHGAVDELLARLKAGSTEMVIPIRDINGNNIGNVTAKKERFDE